MSDGKSAAADDANWLCSRERETFRALVLAAALDVMEREGPEAVTLGAVARQTKIPRATVYSLFSNRQALLSQLVSTQRLGEPVIATDPPPPEDPPKEEMPVSGEEPAAVAEQSPSAATPEERDTTEADCPKAAHPEERDATDTDCAVLEATPAREATVEGEPPQAEDGITNTRAAYDELMREQAEVLQTLTKQVIVPKPRERTDVSRLDARLTVTEQSLAALEQRIGERLKSLTAETSSLNETLQGLRMRLHKFEERQQAALAQLKLEVHRLGKGEASLPSPLPLPEPELDALVEPMEPVAEEADAADVPKMPTYLTSARLAAIHASARAAAMPPPQRSKPPVRRFLRRNRWLLVAVGAVLVGWFDVYVFAHYQPALGAASQEQSQTARPRTVRAAWSPRAQLIRGMKYLNGTGVPVNIDNARLWLERAALSGQPIAQNLMGVMYQTGTGAPQNIAAAIRWYEASAVQGNLKAMTNLGKVYAGGWKEGTDYVKAAEWFTKAASYGEVDAQFDLAILYERGEGVPRNLLQAYKWYMIAGKSGDHKAALRASTLASQIDPNALQAADEAIASYAPLRRDAAANDVPTVSG